MGVRKAVQADLYHINSSVLEIKGEMLKLNIQQWPLDQDYPSVDMIRADLERGDYYVLEIEGQYAGSVVLNTTTTPPYEKIHWQSEEFLAVHRLVSLPAFRVHKPGLLLMQFAEQLAVERGLNSIRLDTYSNNARANAFYRKLGYEFRGEINLPWMPEVYNCYEKSLDPTDGKGKK
ncbi:N-acetyltransferase [Persicobacter diffluens]|uniref:N-acetyltransferase n=2 Tax=Persicobacter diffluens TaxID=981 RepID=A0AAN4W2T0_9BACT|nr:N-acetyltransferase [Persicobacter diffluens]